MWFKKSESSLEFDVRVSTRLHILVLALVVEMPVKFVDPNKKQLKKIAKMLKSYGITASVYNCYEDDQYGRVSWQVSITYGDMDPVYVINVVRGLPMVKNIRHVVYL